MNLAASSAPQLDCTTSRCSCVSNRNRTAMAAPYCRRLSSSLAVLIGVALYFSGIASADYTYQQINQECSVCDKLVLDVINTYQSDFGKWSKAIDGAKYHCARLAKLRSCYTNCLHNNIYTYSSSMKSIFEHFYAGICDPVCYVAVLPYCYTSTVGTYDITKSCNGTNMNQDLKRCVQTELFVKQNCTGVCTQGQRKAMMYFFSTMFQCTIPYQTANECFTWTLYCYETIFGYSGAHYVDYANQSIIASNRLGCSVYGDAFLECVQQGIDGDVILGTPPYTVTYKSPCADFTAELNFLTDFDYTMLVGPFCDNPDQTFNNTCRAYAAPVTIATSSHQALSTPDVITSRATTEPAVATTRATSHYVSTILLTTPSDGSVTSSHTAAAGNRTGGLQSARQPLTPTTTTSAASSRPVESNTAVISRVPQTGAGEPVSSKPSIAFSPSTTSARPISSISKPFSSLESAYRRIILQTGAASVASADSTGVAALLAIAARQIAGVGFI